MSLDVVFYRNFYEDMSSASDEEIVRHWREKGRLEGRFANEAAGRRAAMSSDELPKGFDVASYLRLNPDVAACVRWDFQAALHYVEYGRAEGRAYVDPSEAAADRNGLPPGFNLASYLVCNPDVAEAVSETADRLTHYIEHGREEKRNYAPVFYDPTFVSQLYGVRIPPGVSPDEAVVAVWKRLRPSDDQLIYFNEEEIAKLHGITIPYFSEYFDHNYYQYRYIRQSGNFFNRAQCLRHFCEVGQYEQFDISIDGRFDDEFFCAEYGDDNVPCGPSRRERYESWLRSGADEQLFPNLKVLVRFVHKAMLPRAVEDFIGARVAQAAHATGPMVDHAKPSRVVADLLEWTLDIPGPAAASLFFDVADARAVAGRSIEAAELYARGLSRVPGHSRALNHRADLIHRTGNREKATSLRRHIVAIDAANEWTFRHLADDLLALGETQAASRAMAAGVRKYPGDVGLRRRWREIQEKAFYEVWERSADIALTAGYDSARAFVTEVARSLVRDGERPVSAGRVGRVALYANCDLTQCRFYRVEQRVDQLVAAGYDVTVYDYTKDHAAYMADLFKIDYTIFYRVPAFPYVIDAITKTAELGIATIYDIDDLVFESDYFPPALETYAGLIDARQHASMACGVSLFAEAAALCEYGMASTPSLARHLERRVRSGTVFHQPNAFHSAHRASMAQARTTIPGDVVTIFYGSGTKAHKLDFEQLIEPALARLFGAHGGRIRVVVIGDIALSDRLRPWREFIVVSRPIANVSAFWDLLREADINISVLVPDAFNDCKSEIKWLEAAMFGIPSVVSSTQTHREVIVEGETGFLCTSSSSFFAALDRLVRSPEERRRVGAAAKRAALETYGLERQAQNLRQVIERTSAGQLAPRRKLVIVNVFYPPQAIGGATRVVHDNVRSLRTILGAEWQIDVICTLEGGPVPYAVDWYARDGVRVFCITAADHPSIDSLVEDPEMGRAFERVLDRIDPDLIHFHCMQRFTTTCVAAAFRRKIPHLITMHDGWWISPNQFLTNGNRVVETYDFSGGASLDVFMSEEYARARTLLRCLKGATRLLTVSEPFGALCRGVGLTEVEVVENGVSRLPEVVRTASPDGRVRLGFIGGLADHKGYGLIRNIFFTERFENLSLLLIDHAMHPSDQAAETWGSVPVTMRGKFPQSSVGGLYAHIDVLLAPSIWPESYGLVTREALASGCWVVASDRGAVGDCVVEGRNGYVVDVADEAGLLAALRFIDENPAIHRQAPDYTTPIRSAHQQAEELAVIYAEVLDAAGDRD